MSENKKFAVALMEQIVTAPEGTIDKPHQCIAVMARYDCFNKRDKVAKVGLCWFLDEELGGLIDGVGYRWLGQLLDDR